MKKCNGHEKMQYRYLLRTAMKCIEQICKLCSELNRVRSDKIFYPKHFYANKYPEFNLTCSLTV